MSSIQEEHEPQHEDVWVLVDKVGQPCLRYVEHRRPGQDPPPPPDDLDPDFGPYRVVPYRLVAQSPKPEEYQGESMWSRSL